MKDQNLVTNSLIANQNFGLVRVRKSLQIVNKLIFSESENIFNEAFYLINSAHVQRNSENFLFELEYNPKYLKRRKFEFEANSIEEYNQAIELFTLIILKRPQFKYALYFRAIANSKARNHINAINDYSQAILLKNPFLLLSLGLPTRIYLMN